MEIAIIKRETSGTGQTAYSENETVAKYEIMDGAPVKGESIPIRLFLGAYDLTPTMKDIQRKFSVRYYLNLVLVDEEERRYFKQQEITLWRKADQYKSKLERSNHMQVYESNVNRFDNNNENDDNNNDDNNNNDDGDDEINYNNNDGDVNNSGSNEFNNNNNNNKTKKQQKILAKSNTNENGTNNYEN